MPMKLTSVTISEKPSYLQKEGGCRYHAKCGIQGQSDYNAAITIDIPDEQLGPIVDIMQQLVAQNMAEAAKAFAEDVHAAIGGATVEALA